MSKRKAVFSSIIKSVGWNKGVLEVEFKTNGAVYRYFGVGRDLYLQMVVADSVGSFFKAEIEPHFEYERVK
jgi:hypothetical protein